jgi:serine/threonine protein kinase
MMQDQGKSKSTPGSEQRAAAAAPEDAQSSEDLTRTVASASRPEMDPQTVEAQRALARALAPGRTIADRYRIIEELGEGAMGRVLRVRDLDLEEEVALKVLTAGRWASAELTEQFKKEIRLARRIVHRNVCRTYDLGIWKHLMFVTMELIHGTTLADMIYDQELGDLNVRLDLFRDILLGVRAAHSLSIVHGDIKPLNIMVNSQGQAVVMDFGLARESEKEHADKSSTIVGTPYYIAPERWRGRPADGRSDIYSCGILLYEMIAGKPPFVGTLEELREQHLRATPPVLRNIDPTLPELVDEAIARMLAKSPDDRLGSIDEVLQLLAEVRSSPIGRTVLLATADEDLAALISHHLEAHDLAVHATPDGEQAIEALLREKHDLVVLDREMAKIDGFRVTEILRHYSHLADVPVYLLTTVRDASHEAYAKQLGVTRLVQRPFPVRPFAWGLRRHLEAS